MTAHPDCARLIEDRIKQMGIRFRFGSCITKIEDTPNGVRLSSVMEMTAKKPTCWLCASVCGLIRTS
jgi:hypothetical protein